MKTSLLLIIALLFNTTLLFAEPLFDLVKEIDPLVFVAAEVILVLIYLTNRFLGDFSKAVEINFGQLEIFVYKKKR